MRRVSPAKEKKKEEIMNYAAAAVVQDAAYFVHSSKLLDDNDNEVRYGGVNSLTAVDHRFQSDRSMTTYLLS
uniref:Uncharacterized protein n=1 Tax=Vespula pensylvanica TaxID=30213 RepID=A0A834NH45_VESPE|nr:hypothetical protein H0235_013949 [Vespula pensylvanica]